ncbi:MAG: hypothetical protein HQ472_07970 [Ignavibacteria bacterium]|nr:hypothetical protein [Ignavibacteria bacterium]
MTNIRLVTILALVLSSTAYGQDGIRLLYQMPTSTQYNYSIQNNSHQLAANSGQENSVNVMLDMLLHITVKDVVLNRSTLEFRIDSTKVRRAPNTPSFSLNALQNIGFNLTLTPDGTIIRTEALYPDSTLDELNKVLESYRLLDWIFTPFPRHDVNLGDSWLVEHTDTTLLNFGPVVNKVSIKYTLFSVSDTLGITCWVIDFESTSYSLTGDISGTGFVARFDGVGKIDGRAFHDKITGAPVTMYVDTQTDSQVHFTNPNVTIPVSSRLRSQVVRVNSPIK